MKPIQLQVQPRTNFGKKAKALTDEGMVLGNLVGKGVDSTAFAVEYQTMRKVVLEAGKNTPVEISFDGESRKELALIQVAEAHPATHRLHHVSLQIVHRGQKVTAEVPLHLVGEAPAVRGGNMLITNTDAVEVETIPSKLPENLELDVSVLENEGDTLMVSDIKAPADVEIVTDGDTLVCKIEAPRAAVEADAEEEAEVDAADVPSENGGDDAEGTSEE